MAGAVESSIPGLVVDSDVLIAAERRNMTAAQAIEDIQTRVGECPIVLSVITVAELGHGIYRANTPMLRNRRRAFLDELKSTVPIYPITESTCRS